jgi:hypothetical protein
MHKKIGGETPSVFLYATGKANFTKRGMRGFWGGFIVKGSLQAFRF